MATTKADVMTWVDMQLAQDAKLQAAVAARLAELRLEQQLAQLREARGLTQQQAARLAGVSQPAVAKLESGTAKNVELKTLLRMVTALGGHLHVEISPVAKVVGIHARHAYRSSALAPEGRVLHRAANGKFMIKTVQRRGRLTKRAMKFDKP